MSTLAQTCDAIAAYLGADPAIRRTESYASLTESVVSGDLPVMQVYPQRSTTGIASTDTERSTFRAGVRQTEEIYYVDVFCSQRAHLGQDMARTIAVWDALQTKLETITVKPYFADAGIKAFGPWLIERMVWTPDSTTIFYTGIRITLPVRKF